MATQDEKVQTGLATTERYHSRDEGTIHRYGSGSYAIDTSAVSIEGYPACISIRQHPLAEINNAVLGVGDCEWNPVGYEGDTASVATGTSEAAKRKGRPVATGVIDYFPDALLAIAEVSRVGNEQHNPGKPLFWDRSKSGDEADALMRHFIERGTMDTDGVRHSAKVAWRALALLQKEIESARLKTL